MSKIIKVLEIFSNPKTVKDSFCAIRHSVNNYKRYKVTRPCLAGTLLNCIDCAFYINNQKMVNTIVKENSIYE